MLFVGLASKGKILISFSIFGGLATPMVIFSGLLSFFDFVRFCISPGWLAASQPARQPDSQPASSLPASSPTSQPPARQPASQPASHPASSHIRKKQNSPKWFPLYFWSCFPWKLTNKLEKPARLHLPHFFLHLPVFSSAQRQGSERQVSGRQVSGRRVH